MINSVSIFNLENHQSHSQASQAAASSSPSSSSILENFRSKIRDFITQRLLQIENGSESLTLEWFQACFRLVSIGIRAFDSLVMELDEYSGFKEWDGRGMDEYLKLTLDLMDLLNLITSAISRLNQARVSVVHALSVVESSQSGYSGKSLGKIPGKSLSSRDFKLKGLVARGVAVQSPPGCDRQMEPDILRSLAVLKKVGFLALGFILSGLWSDEKPYLEVRKGVDEDNDDPMIKALDSRFWQGMKEMQGGLAEVKEVNRAVEQLSRGRCQVSANELNNKLEALERSIQGLEKQASDLFSEVLAARNKILDSIRLTGKV